MITSIVEGGLYNWVVHLKIFIRENNVKKENLDQHTPSHSPRAPGTKQKIGKERGHREELSQSVNLMSVVFARKNSRKDQMRRLCNKKDAPAEQRGTWRKYLPARECGQSYGLYTPIEARVMLAPLRKDQRSENSQLIQEHQCT